MAGAGIRSRTFVIGFLYQYFIRPNARSLSEQDATLRLEDYLHHITALNPTPVARGRLDQAHRRLPGRPAAR